MQAGLAREATEQRKHRNYAVAWEAEKSRRARQARADIAIPTPRHTQNQWDLLAWEEISVAVNVLADDIAARHGHGELYRAVLRKLTTISEIQNRLDKALRSGSAGQAASERSA